MENGDLHDFNCVGKKNVVAYDAYLPSCDNKIGSVYLATDVCYKFCNQSNITNDVYPDIPRDAWYQLSQINLCERDVVTVDTYIHKGCGTYSPDFKTPVASSTANGECGNYVKAKGFDLYAKVTKCIKDGVDTFADSNASVK